MSERTSCDRWMKARATDAFDGTEGVLDRYVRDVPVPDRSDVDAVFARLENRLLRYDVFPTRLMRAEICSADGRLYEGTTIVQHVAIGPFTLESAVRVVRAWRVEDANLAETGFAYVTLEGHPERGVSSFRVSRDSSGQIEFAIEARSSPGSLLTRLGGPFACRFQRRATEAALDHFALGQ